jgi:hypothetical protein
MINDGVANVSTLGKTLYAWVIFLFVHAK